MAPILCAEAVTVGYDGPPILDRVSIEIQEAMTTVVLGPNGAGKSTLAKAMVGLLRPTGGRVLLRDQDITGLGPHKLVRRGVAYLPQLMNVFGDMSVIENLEMGGYTLRRGAVGGRAKSVLELFPDLAADHGKKARALSGGQQKMLALARVLMTDPVVAILDEPTAGLSPLYADRVWEQIDTVRAAGVALMVVEQNAVMAMEHADMVCVLGQGRNVTSGPAAELRDREEVARILVG